MLDLSYEQAIENADHLIALGETTVYLRRNETGFPYEKVTHVEAGAGWRLSGPSSCYLFAEDAGLTFKLSVDFEGPEANGRGVSLFDRDRLRGLMLRLPDAARQSFADLLETEVMPGMAKRTAEIRNSLLEQADSEDCVRGLIAFAREPVEA
jgi:hypothetical protein